MGSIATRQKPIRSTSSIGQSGRIKSLHYTVHLIPPPISSTRLTVHTHLWMLFFYHYYCVIKTFGVLFIKGKEYYPGEKALHLPELITVHFTGNKVCGIHFFVAINQDGNKWLNLKPPGSHNQSISWYSPLVCSTCFSSKPILAW